MNIGIENLIENIGMPFEWTLLFIVIVAGIVFYANDPRIGIILHMLGTGALSLWFYNAGYDFVPSLVVFFMFIVILAFTLYSVARSPQVAQIQ